MVSLEMSPAEVMTNSAELTKKSASESSSIPFGTCESSAGETDAIINLPAETPSPNDGESLFTEQVDFLERLRTTEDQLSSRAQTICWICTRPAT